MPGISIFSADQRLRVLQSLPCGLLVMNARSPDREVVFANEMLSRMIGITPPEKLVGRPIADVMKECCTPEQQEILSSILANEKYTSFEIEKDAEGKQVWYRLHILPLRDKKGKAEMFVCMQVDRTEEKLQEAKLFHSQKLESLGQLAGGVAHDFNNILSIIDGYARITKKEIVPGSAAQSYLDRVIQAVKRGADLTQRLLAFGRGNMGAVGIHNLGELIEEQETLLRALLDATVRLEIKIQQDVWVKCAPDGISQILMNLCINARDAMPDGGIITIGVEECTQVCQRKEKCPFKQAVLTVRDTGCGMDDMTRQRLFDPFYTTKERGKGAGLGLSVVYGLVQQMRGTIKVDSLPGKGSEFSLYFPVSEKAAPKPVMPEEEDATLIRFDGFTTLVAEDEDDLRNLMAGMLEDMGMKVICAANGNEALLKQEEYEGKIDFLLTDVVMPGLNGVRLSELIVSERPDIHVVYMSGYPAGGQMARTEVPEEACLLQKPVDVSTLAHTLYSLCCPAENDNETLQRMAGEWSPSQTH